MAGEPDPSPSAAGAPPPRAASFETWRRLRELIVRGALEPGARLSEAEIALRRGVSRQPVREAFIRLADEGLVEIRPQRGSFVSRIRIDLVNAARFVREAVEVEVVRRVVERGADAAMPELDRLLARQAAAAEDDPEGFAALDEAFHRRLAEAAGVAGGWELLQPLKTHMDRVRHLNVRRFPIINLVDQHRAVAAALRAGDAERAEAAMRAHLRRILEDLPVVAAELPHFFEPSAGAEGAAR